MVTSSNDKSIKIFTLKKINKKIVPRFELSLNFHNSFVKKVELSSDISILYSLDQNCFKVSKIQESLQIPVDKLKTQTKVRNYLGDKEEVYSLRALEEKGNFLNFHLIQQDLVLLVYESANFEIFNLKTKEKVKSFCIGENGMKILKSSFSMKTQSILLLSEQNGLNKLLSFDILNIGNSEVFEVDSQVKVNDIILSSGSGYFLTLADRDILIWKRNSETGKLQTKKKSPKQRRNKIEGKEQQTDKPNSNHIFLMKKCAEITNSLNALTQGFVALDQKLARNEEKTRNLMTSISEKH